jgi:hypothetical protein
MSVNKKITDFFLDNSEVEVTSSSYKNDTDAYDDNRSDTSNSSTITLSSGGISDKYDEGDEEEEEEEEEEELIQIDTDSCEEFEDRVVQNYVDEMNYYEEMGDEMLSKWKRKRDKTSRQGNEVSKKRKINKMSFSLSSDDDENAVSSSTSTLETTDNKKKQKNTQKNKTSK